MSSVVTGTNQNIYDIALQEYGSIEGVLKLVKDICRAPAGALQIS